MTDLRVDGRYTIEKITFALSAHTVNHGLEWKVKEVPNSGQNSHRKAYQATTTLNGLDWTLHYNEATGSVTLVAGTVGVPFHDDEQAFRYSTEYSERKDVQDLERYIHALWYRVTDIKTLQQKSQDVLHGVWEKTRIGLKKEGSATWA